MAFAPVFSESGKNSVLRSPALSEEFEPARDKTTYLVTRDGKSLDALEYTDEEVLTIAQMFSDQRLESQIYLHDQASEENFKARVGGAKYLHVATHGFIQNEFPKLSNLAFSQPQDSTAAEDGILYSGETYNLDLSAALLVLSACQSGAGKIVRGEGLMA